MTLTYSHLPTIEIEMQVDECVQLLVALQSRQQPLAQPPVQESLFQMAPSQPTKPKAKSKPEVAVRQPPTQQAPTVETQAESLEDEARPYKGKINRRHRVLEIFQECLEKGIDALSIQQITSAFQERFPEEDSGNLDQVVRDLMAKTDKVKRVKRGFYALS